MANLHPKPYPLSPRTGKHGPTKFKVQSPNDVRLGISRALSHLFTEQKKRPLTPAELKIMDTLSKTYLLAERESGMYQKIQELQQKVGDASPIHIRRSRTPRAPIS